MNERPLVSMIIPAYNASRHIGQTILSIHQQAYPNLEIIVVNDHSTDNTVQVVNALALQYVRVETNPTKSGVSGARNFGMTLAKGKYICFFDADDLMAPRFIDARIDFLENNPGYIGCCARVIKKFESTGEYSAVKFNGVSNNPLKSVLLFDKTSITCPSNFIFQRYWLETTQVKFNPELSSSADRFFLLEITLWSKIAQITTPESELIYLVRQSSMSHLLTNNLLDDNYRFKKEVLKKIPLTAGYKKDFSFKINYVLCGGHYKMKNWSKFFKFFAFTALRNPVKFIQQRY